MPSSPGPTPTAQVRSSEVLSALSYALDIVEGQPEGHAVRSCMIGMRVADELRVDSAERSALLYALLLKDLGCSSNAAKVCFLFGSDDRTAKRDLKTTNWTSITGQLRYILRNVAREGDWRDKIARLVGIAFAGKAEARRQFELRCDRGATIARDLGFTDDTASAIRSLDEHWDGHGYPDGRRHTEIPYLARILCLAQSVEVFHSEYGRDAAFEMVRDRAGSWFDPELCRLFRAIEDDDAFWTQLESNNTRAQRQYVLALEPTDRVRIVDEAGIDQIARAFGQVIDAKSPWTFQHSAGVAEIAHGIGARLDLSPRELVIVRRAGWLHDIGKLGISNQILNKPGQLTDDEFDQIRLHPAYTHRILERVPCFASIADLAASHHEKLDGSGYHRGLTDDLLSPSARALVVADIYEALAAKRPYRDDLTTEQVFDIMARSVGDGICPRAFAALQSYVAESGFTPYQVAA